MLQYVQCVYNYILKQSLDQSYSLFNYMYLNFNKLFLFLRCKNELSFEQTAVKKGWVLLLKIRIDLLKTKKKLLINKINV